MDRNRLQEIYRCMLWIVPSMLLCIVGDYCIGIEPSDSYAISGMISSGWLTIADWRIALSNIGGFVGTACYAAAALPFAEYLRSLLPGCGRRDRLFLRMYIAGLILGVMCFMYFHIACGTLIHSYGVILEAAGGNTALAVEMWNRTYMVQVIPYWMSFFSFELSVLAGWTALILRGVFPLKKIWILASPLVVAGAGFVLELLIPWPFNGFASGFESFGWIIMFIAGRKMVRKDILALEEREYI